ncbi:MAG: AsmA family protein, partial [Saprospiraceae bacterium]|nr:AsmA family protein [Saprospiraceae bacterium]
MKKVIKWIGVSVIGLLLMLLVLPYFFKDQIIDEVKKGLNENFNAVVDFSDVSLSLIKSFPHLQVTLHDLSIEGMGDFAGISLLDANQASAAIDFWSLFGSAKEILSVEAQSPYINFLVLPDGRANYDIVRTKEDDSKSSPPTQFQVDWYEIINGSFFYDDQAAQLTFA